MRARIVVTLACLLVTGCGCFAGGRWHPFGAPPAPPPTPAPVTPAEPEPLPTVPPSVRPVEAPKSAPEIAKVENGDRAKRITSARGDLKTGLTALELRAVTACTEPGEACVDNQALMARAKALDARLAAALLDPKASVDWAEVTTVLRAVVDTAMKGKP